MRRIARLLAVLMIAASVRAMPAWGQYRAEQFTSANGLPQNTVSGIAQTPDGYLWFATYDGLVRYDGVTFTILDRANTPPMAQTQFLTLTVDGAGTLWAGTTSGLLRYRRSAFDWVPPRKGDVLRVHPADPYVQPAFVPPAFPHWRYRADSVEYTGSGAQAAYYVPMPADTFAHAAFEDREGRLWLPQDSGRLYVLTPDSAHLYTTRDGLPDEGLRMAGETGNGVFWAWSESDVCRLAGTRWVALDSTVLPRTPRTRGLAPRRLRDIRAALVDRDGTLWVGTNANGMFRITPRLITTYGTADGLLDPSAYVVLADRTGTIWIGTSLGLTRVAHGRFTSDAFLRAGDGSYRLVPATPAAHPTAAQATGVRSMLEDREGRVWVGLTDALVAFRGGHIVREIRTGHGYNDAILEARDGALWVGTPRLVMRLHGDSIRTFGRADGLPPFPTQVLYQDREGTIWIGTRRGLARWDGRRFTTFTERDGLAGNNVRSIVDDPEGALWIGTFDNGISRYRDGKFASITSAGGLFANAAFVMLLDRDDNFWMSSNRGIYRVGRRQLDDFMDGRLASVSSVSYGIPDGMRSTEANGGRQPAGAIGPDGRIWFPTQDGVVAVDPAAEWHDPKPALVAFSDVIVDGKPVPIGPAVELSPDQTELEFNYTAPSSFHADNIQFRYRLLGGGGDTAWIAAGTRRRVHYSHLRPASYRFEVMAANSDGVWGTQPAGIDVTVDPRFYQTSWFLALVAFALVGGAASAYSLRVRGLKRQERRLTKLVAERTADLRTANERLAQLAIEDPLTGLANRRRYDEFLEHEWRRALRARAPLAVMVLDVDHFKGYNDAYGHQAGDECLRRVAAAVQGVVRRGTDLAARYGGEEFAVVLTATAPANVAAVAEAIRAAVEALGIPHRASGAAPHVTVSIGTAVMVPDDQTTADDLVREADRALYRAKEGGRNRVA
ncbi:MAG: diguanylate cyclase [Gemmatimonadota bacterium]|nr:diguanylate cyclase [Gemmatimonadota bacterium]